MTGPVSVVDCEFVASRRTFCGIILAIPEDVREIIYLRIAIARSERGEIEAPLDQLQNGTGFVFSALDRAPLNFKREKSVNLQVVQFTPQQKVSISAEHFIEHVSASDLCDKHKLHPTLFYKWQKAVATISPKLTFL
jgi:transposase